MKKLNYIVIFLLSVISTSCIREDNTPVKIPAFDGGVLTLNEKADPHEAEQIWIDLNTGKFTKTHRELWDLGFYCGDEFRVILNSSLVMSVGKIENAYNINTVNSQNIGNLKSLVQVGNFTDNSKYIDHPNGDITNQITGIDEINVNDNFNGVYLLNMGFKVSTENPVPGSIYTAGEERGWKKIRILRQATGYKIQYADLDDTQHKEFIITKDSEYNYKFFSLLKNDYAEIQPKKKNWDLCFTVFTNLTLNPVNNLPTSYIYPDVILHNILGGVGAYEVVTTTGNSSSAYTNFKKEDVDFSKFVFNDQRAIGSNWRTTTGTNGTEVFSNKFYVLKNSDGFFFKLRFLRMKDDNGYRGYPQFEYKAL